MDSASTPAHHFPPPFKACWAAIILWTFCLTSAAATTGTLKIESGAGDPKTDAGLGDVVVIALDPFPTDDTTLQSWVLYVDGVAVSGDQPVVDYPHHTLHFTLWRDGNNQKSIDAWAKLHRGFIFVRNVEVAVGPEDKPKAALSVGTLKFVVVPSAVFIVYIVGVGSLLLFIVITAKNSELLRDRDTIPPAGQRCPYSLGLTQMAFWFIMVLAAYLYIGIVNWNYLNTITAPTLGLLGISATTGLGALLIDNDKVEKAKNLRGEQLSLQARLNELPGLIATANPQNQPALTDEQLAKKARLALILPDIAALPVRNWASQGFFMDLVSDDAGVSLHRFQIAVWTLILGGVFMGTVLRELVMPEFSSTLLALMGISSGTYLGFKFPEKKG